MNKSPLLIVLFLLSFYFNYAQTLDIGIKGGINYNNIGDFQATGSGYSNDKFEAENEIGTQFGFFFNLNYEHFFIRPEVNYVSFKNSYSFPKSPAKWEAKQVDVPILLGYNIYGPISIFAGPVFNFISDMNMEGWQDLSFSDAFTYNNSSTSISAGILLDFGMVGIDFRYQYGLTTIEEQRLDMKNNIYGVNLGDLLEYNPSQFMLNIQIKLFTLGGGDKKNKRSGSVWRNHKNL